MSQIKTFEASEETSETSANAGRLAHTHRKRFLINLIKLIKFRANSGTGGH